MEDERKKILVPLLTEREGERDFLDKIADIKTIKKIVLVFVIDREKMGDVPAGFVGTKIKAAENVIEKIKKDMPKDINVEEYIEWGSWLDKVENISKLEKIDEILMIKSETADELFSELKERDFNVNVFTFQKPSD